MEKTDYSHEGFKVVLNDKENIFYASINAIFNPSHDGLVPNGDYIIVLLHPKLGTFHFLLKLDNKALTWIPENAPKQLEEGLVDKICDCIESRTL